MTDLERLRSSVDTMFRCWRRWEKNCDDSAYHAFQHAMDDAEQAGIPALLDELTQSRARLSAIPNLEAMIEMVRESYAELEGRYHRLKSANDHNLATLSRAGDELAQARRENAALRAKLDAVEQWLRNETDRKRNPCGRGYLLHSHGCKCLSLDPEAMKHLDVGEYAHYGEEHCTCGLGQILDSLAPEPRSEETTNVD